MGRWRKKLQELFGIDIRSLALFRMGLALVLIGDLLNRLQDLNAHYTDNGVLPRDALIYHFLDSWHFSLHLMNGSWEFQALLFSLAILFSCGLLLGCYTRLSTVCSWILLISLHTRNPLLIHGGDTLLRMLLFWGMFLPLGAYWSIDHWRSREGKLPFQVLSVATCALLLQVCMMYWTTALLKTDGIWREEGSAVWYAFSNEFFATSIARSLLDYPILLRVLTFSTLPLELFGPFFAFIPFWTAQIRSSMALVFMCFHLVLGMTLELGIFSYIAVVGWIPFLPGWFWDRFSISWPVASVQRKPTPLLYHKLSACGINGIAFCFLVYVMLWNLRSINGISLPFQFNTAASVMRIDQSWNMFAPFPLREDGWFLIPATLRNGKTMDLYANRALDWQKPELCSSCFSNDRWRSFMLNLVFDDQSDVNLSYYAGYLWDNWNETHPYEEHLLDLEIVWMSKRNSVENPSMRHEKLVLWRYGE